MPRSRGFPGAAGLSGRSLRTGWGADPDLRLLRLTPKPVETGLASGVWASPLKRPLPLARLAAPQYNASVDHSRARVDGSRPRVTPQCGQRGLAARPAWATPRRGPGSRVARALTVIETVIAGALLALVLWVLSGLYDDMLDRARTAQAFEMIRTLDAALAAYHQAAGAHPPGRHGPDGSAVEDALTVMIRVPESLRVLHGIDLRLLHLHDDRPVCRDPWGRPLRYLTAGVGDEVLAGRVARHAGRPIFESAGPDGRFGDHDPAAAADDIRSDEPGISRRPTETPPPA